MKLSSHSLAAAVLLAFLLFLPLAVDADDTPTCDLPDGPAVEQHIEHADILGGRLSFDEVFAAGRLLFDAKFNECDGQGRPATTGAGDKREPIQPRFIRTSAPDAGSCAACHNEPRSGGGGDFVANVFVLAQARDPVIESVSSEFSNERNTVGMFGSGPIEMLAREMTADLQALRRQAIDEAAAGQPVTVSLDTKGVSFGSLTALPDGTVDTSKVEGVDLDLIVKPFHQAGVVVSLREFSNNAFNHHHGMQSEERFDLDSQKGADFDEDGHVREMTIGDITAVTIFQAALATPGRLLPADADGQAAVDRGEMLFEQIGCADCHIPEMRLESRFFSEPNPYNPDGNFKDLAQAYAFDMTTQGETPRLERDGEGAVVRAYTDLKRHNLCDEEDADESERYYCNERLAQNRPDVGERPGSEYFVTRKLWDAGNSAPYGHRGDLTSIDAAIMYHGGEARPSRQAYDALPFSDQQAMVSFLKTLQVLPPGSEPIMVEGQQPANGPQPIRTVDWVTLLTGVAAAGMGLAILVLSLGWSWRQRQEAARPSAAGD